MTDRAAEIVRVHVPGPDGCCQGCLAWWGLLMPYPCWQARWALELTTDQLELTTDRRSADPTDPSSATPGAGRPPSGQVPADGGRPAPVRVQR